MVAPQLTAAFLTTLLFCSFGACSNRSRNNNDGNSSNVAAPNLAAHNISMSEGFAYPIGPGGRVTRANDGDGWYNALDFGERDHLGEDWNAETGGDSDCGQPVYAASKGTIAFAGEAGPGWGKVIIVRHRLPDDTLIETLYGHLQSISRTSGDVDRHERIGNIGNADGAYPCHLHLELRLSTCPAWGVTGPGYGSDRQGWTDPSDFIDAHAPPSAIPRERL